MLFAPEKGAEVRAKICEILHKHGCEISDKDVDALVAELAASEKK